MEYRIRLQYKAKFDKTVVVDVSNGEEMVDVIERVQRDMEKHPNDYTDGNVIEFDDVEEM